MPRPADHYLFFWKPTQKHGWASQWYNSPFTELSSSSESTTPVLFPTAEHYMMYHKALLFDDPHIAAQILTVNSPAAVKKLGLQVHNFDEDQWKANRSVIVRRGNLLKFTQNPDLAVSLLATGEKILAEASPSDRIWGIGKVEANALANKDEWGLNLLGLALMEVREQLRAEEQDAPEPEPATEETA